MSGRVKVDGVGAKSGTTDIIKMTTDTSPEKRCAIGNYNKRLSLGI